MSIKTLFIVLAAMAFVFALIRFVPVYIEQNKLIHDVDELARVAALRGYKEERIHTDIERLRSAYELPEGSINMVSKDNKVEITLGYTRTIDLIVTTYDWQVEHKARGKEL